MIAKIKIVSIGKCVCFDISLLGLQRIQYSAKLTSTVNMGLVLFYAWQGQVDFFKYGQKMTSFSFSAKSHFMEWESLFFSFFPLLYPDSFCRWLFILLGTRCVLHCINVDADWARTEKKKKNKTILNVNTLREGTGRRIEK